MKFYPDKLIQFNWNQDHSAIILRVFFIRIVIPSIIIKLTGIEALRLAQLRHKEEKSLLIHHSFTKDEYARIERFTNQQTKRHASRVVYTCITNDYDDIFEIACPGYIQDNCDYICFTDNKTHIMAKRIGIWEIRPLCFSTLDNTRNNRWHKMHPHLLFRDYIDSIYIDANINIISDYLFKIINKRNQSILSPVHDKHNSIYEEYELAKQCKMDNYQLINAEEKLIRASGMPANYGMTEMNIIYRRHNEPSIVSLDEEWWEMITKYAKRDQLSFTWLLWKRGITVETVSIENARIATNHFFINKHKRVFSK